MADAPPAIGFRLGGAPPKPQQPMDGYSPYQPQQGYQFQPPYQQRSDYQPQPPYQHPQTPYQQQQQPYQPYNYPPPPPESNTTVIVRDYRLQQAPPPQPDPALARTYGQNESYKSSGCRHRKKHHHHTTHVVPVMQPVAPVMPSVPLPVALPYGYGPMMHPRYYY